MPNPLINILNATLPGATTGTEQADQTGPQDGSGFLEVLNLIGKAEQVEPEVPEDLVAQTEGVEISVDSEPSPPEADPELPPIAVPSVGDTTRMITPANIEAPDPEMGILPEKMAATFDSKEQVERVGILNTGHTDGINQIAAPPTQAIETAQKPRPSVAEIAQQTAVLRRAGKAPKPPESPPDTDLTKPAPVTSATPHASANTPAIAAIATGAPPPLKILASTTVQERDLGDVDAKSDPFGAPREGALPPTIRELPGAALPRPETARAIAGQIAAVIMEKPGAGNFQIALNPEELGRVSITMGGREDGLHLMIAAERPETLDLMRRHIAVLADEFQKLGFGDLSFDLGQSGGNAADADESPEHPLLGAQTPEAAAEPAPHPIPTGPERGLDLRL